MSVTYTRRVIDGYELHAELAVGGMASVHLGRCLDPNGPSGLVAIKRLHEHLARDPAFANVLLQEARITERIRHPNVVTTLDVVAADRELLLVMEYVAGETVSSLLRALAAREMTCSIDVAASVIRDTLRGLQAAHATTDANGESLRIVHRDVSPQNIIVATTGVAKVLDFGIAKIIGNLVHTRTGELKGKIPYMAPEIFHLEPATPQSDVWAAAVVLWEMLCGRRLFKGESDVTIWAQVESGPIPTPREVLGARTALDDVVMRGLSRDRSRRYQSAAEMAADIERALEPASPAQVAAWMDGLASKQIATRREMVKSFHDTVVMAVPSAALAPPGVPPAPKGVRSVPASANGSSGPPAARSTARAAWALVAVLALAILALLASRASSPRPASAAGASPSSSQALAPASSEMPPSPPPAEIPSVSAVAPASSSQHPQARPGRTRWAPRPRPSESCNPPYTVDATGRKIFKLECIK